MWSIAFKFEIVDNSQTIQRTISEKFNYNIFQNVLIPDFPRLTASPSSQSDLAALNLRHFEKQINHTQTHTYLPYTHFYTKHLCEKYYTVIVSLVLVMC